MISVEVKSSAEVMRLGWRCKAANPHPSVTGLVAILAGEAVRRHPRSGVVIIIRRAP